MNQLKYQCSFDIQLDNQVKEHVFVLRALPKSFPGQEILSSRLLVRPGAVLTNQEDSFGNLLQYGRIDEEHNHFSYQSEGIAKVDLSKRIPEPVLPIYRFASPLTECTEKEKEEALQLKEKNERAFHEALCSLVHEKLIYTPGKTSIDTKAIDALSSGHGVCQDYAHIYLMYMRAAGLPARYVNGYCLGEGSSHAWVEVLENDIWTGIDPTRNKYCDEQYIRFNVGRDYLDCPLEQGVFKGYANQFQQGYSSICLVEE